MINLTKGTVMDIRNELACSPVHKDRNSSHILKKNSFILLFAVPNVFIASIFNLVHLPFFQRNSLGPTCPPWACLHFNDVTLVPAFRHPNLSLCVSADMGSRSHCLLLPVRNSAIGIMAGRPIRLPYLLSGSPYMETDLILYY